MKVVKFGGSSVASAAQIKKVAEIVVADPERCVVVVSAPGRRNKRDAKVTDMLIELARAGIAGGDTEAPLQRIAARFAEIAKGLKLHAEILEPIVEDLRARLAGLSTNDAPTANRVGVPTAKKTVPTAKKAGAAKGSLSEEAYLDNLKAAGEDHTARIVAAYLRKLGHDAHYVNPKDAGLILSDEPGHARVLTSSYGKLHKSLRRHPGIVVFPGFFGYSESGRVVTFSRGGSDITGAILAAAIEASVYENFTDVDSVYACDPRIVPNPLGVREITYREMRELSYAGFSVFHDEALEPVFHAGIPVNVRNTNNPSAPGTLIVPKRDAGEMPIVGIAATSGFCSIFVSKYLMNREVGFGRRVLHILEDEGVPFEHIPTGIDNMSVVMRESRFGPATEERVTRRIRQELIPDEISVERDLALVMVVGEGMRHMIGIAGRACSGFANAGVNLEMINQGSSEVSMMFGIKAKDATAAVRALYNDLIAGRKRARKNPR